MPLSPDERAELLGVLFEALPGLNQPTWLEAPDQVLMDLVGNLPGFGEDEDLSGDMPAEAVGEPLAKMGSRSAPGWTRESATRFGEAIARRRGGAERAKVVAFAERNAEVLRRAGQTPEKLVKTFDRMTYGKRPGSVKASALLGGTSAAEARPVALPVSSFAERRAHRLYERQRVERFAEKHGETLKKFRYSKESVLATFDRMLERNPAATLEDLTGAGVS